MIDYKLISSNLRALREARGIKQKFIAEQLGITPNYYTQIEQGHRRPQLDHILKISEMFDVSLDDIFFSEEIAYCEVNEQDEDQAI